MNPAGPLPPDEPGNPGPIVWTIAGTDPSGGAGIQADLKTIHGLSAYGASIITAILAQNTRGVQRAEPVAPDMVAAQIDVLATDLPPAAVKVGMLAQAETVRIVADRLAQLNVPVVCDPVLGSSSGFDLLDKAGVEVLREHFLPCIDVLTPNRPEARILTGLPAETADEIEAAARSLLAKGTRAVLLTGGHGAGAMSQDLLLETGESPLWLAAPRLNVTHTHGTGCTLSAALATALAHGLPLRDACEVARAYVQQGLRRGGGIGRGQGPLFHGGWPEEPEDYPQIRSAPWPESKSAGFTS